MNEAAKQLIANDIRMAINSCKGKEPHGASRRDLVRMTFIISGNPALKGWIEEFDESTGFITIGNIHQVANGGDNSFRPGSLKVHLDSIVAYTFSGSY